VSQDKPRWLQVLVKLPEYATDAERLSLVDADVRAAVRNGQKMIANHFAGQFSTTGWEYDGDPEMGLVNGERTIIVRQRIVRK
jgi:hypothetical protein